MAFFNGKEILFSPQIHTNGYDEGLDEGYKAGQKAEYDRFWDAYQDNGNRVNYSFAFGNNYWNNETFKPKYNIKPTAFENGFKYFGFVGDVADYLEKLGVTFSFENFNAYTATQAFRDVPYVTRWFTLDFSGMTSANYMFYNSPALETIDKIILPEEKAVTFTETFTQCPALKNISFEGKIMNTISFAPCPLSVESMENIINHLYDFSGTNPYSHTLTFSEECWERLESEGSTPPMGSGWRDYVDILGWNT